MNNEIMGKECEMGKAMDKRSISHWVIKSLKIHSKFKIKNSQFPNSLFPSMPNKKKGWKINPSLFLNTFLYRGVTA